MPPQALQPRYSPTEPDAAIELFSGDLELIRDQIALRAHGKVAITWQPACRLSFDIELDEPWTPVSWGPDHMDNWTLSIDGYRPVPVSIQRLNVSGTAENNPTTAIQGVLSGAVTIGNPCPVSAIRFHVPNFPRYFGGHVIEDEHGERGGRVRAVTNDWTLTLDQVREWDEAGEDLKRYGYGITHVGEIRNIDSSPIAFEALARILDDLHWWLSLARGERTGPLLVSGIYEDEVIWEHWESIIVAPWKYRQSWLPRVIEDGVSLDGGSLQVLRNTMRSDDGESLREVIDWYTQSVSAIGSPATSLVLAHAGLELVSWLKLVNDVGLDSTQFSRLPAEDILRLALSYTYCNTAVPDTLSDLAAVAETEPALDGPSSVSRMRNAIIHPKREERFRKELHYDGAQLAIWFLERLLLHRLDYRGNTADRLRDFNSVRVPWSQSRPGRDAE